MNNRAVPQFHILVALIVLFGSGLAFGQEDALRQYVPSTIPAMTAKFLSATKNNADQVFVTESYLIKTRLLYTGASRKVSEKKTAFLAKWLKENQYPPEMLPSDEYQFSEGQTKYWLVIQNIVAPHFVQEIKSSAEADLYLVLMGSIREDNNRSFVILVNEFKRPEDEAPSGPRTGNSKRWGDKDSLQGYEGYIDRTLREIISAHSNSNELTKSNMLLTGDTFPSRVRVTYMGASKRIAPLKRQHLDMLTTSFGVDPKLIAKYETEMLFLEGTDEHWLPVQQDLIPFFEKELVKGEEVILYLEWVGARKIEDKWTWVFIVNEFQKLKKTTITGESTGRYEF